MGARISAFKRDSNFHKFTLLERKKQMTRIKKRVYYPVCYHDPLVHCRNASSNTPPTQTAASWCLCFITRLNVRIKNKNNVKLSVKLAKCLNILFDDAF